MNKEFKRIFLIGLLILLVKNNFYSQLTVTSATACPSQTMQLSANWPNVGSVTYTISRSSTSFTQQASANFTVSDVGPGPSTVVYTITANGTALSGPVTSSTTATLTIIPPAPFSVSDLGNGYYCYNRTATLSAPSGATSNYSLTGPPGAPIFSSFNNNIISIPNMVSPTYDGVYTITASYNGCVRSGTTQISVSPNSQMTVNAPVNVCQGDPVNLSANVAAGTNTSYVWSASNGNFSATGANTTFIAQPNNTATYTVSALFAFGPGPSATTCPASATTAVSVLATSAVTANATSTVLCQGSNLNLVAYISISSPVTWHWTGPQFTSSQNTPILSNITPADAGVYTVTASFSNNQLTCPKTGTVAISVITTVDPNPIAPANICQNDTAYLSVTAPGATGFLWSTPTFTSTSPTPSFVAQPNASGPYYVTAKFGPIPCLTTKSIVVNVVPVNSITVIPPTPVCQPDNAYLQASAIGATSYSWNGPNGNVGYMANTTIFHPALNASGIYTVTMGFGNSILTCYNTNTVQLTVKPLLNFSLTAPGQVCYNSDVHLAGPAGATSYSWTSSASYVSNTQNVDLLSIQPSQAGTYYLTVSLNGCITSGSTTIDVLEPIKFSQPFFDRTICHGDTVFMDAPITGGTENNAYVWEPSLYLSAGTGSSVVGVPLGTTIYNVSAHDIICPNYSISASIKVTVNQPPALNLHIDKIEGCAPLNQLYNSGAGKEAAWVTYDFGGNLRYQQDSTFIPLNNPGTYTLNVTLTGTNGCSGTVTYPQPIFVYPSPALRIVTDPDVPTITDNITFGAGSNTSLTSYLWIFDNGAGFAPDTVLTATPVKSYINSGIFPVYLVATTDMGCADTVVKFLEIRENFNVFIPNSFTPNGDNVNDVFQLKGSGISSDHFSMELFDRKGHVLFSTHDVNAGWDGVSNGSVVQQDVYVYKITLVGAHSEGKKEYVGHFSLLR